MHESDVQMGLQREKKCLTPSWNKGVFLYLRRIRKIRWWQRMPSLAYVQRCIQSDAVVTKAVDVGHSKARSV